MPQLTAARNAVGLAFILNGLCFASWVSRIPEARDGFGLSNGGLGVLLLMIAIGSIVALPTTGAAIGRWGTVRVLRAGAVVAALGLGTAGLALGDSLVVTGVALLFYGVGIGVWDVAMNVEGAEVERRLGRTVMPRFHAGFSLGTVVGALAGAGLVALDVPSAPHLVLVVVVSAAVVWRGAAAFLPVPEVEESGRTSAARAWLEPRTLLIGVMVLALAMTEGTANDWLAVALVDGYDVSHAVGVAGFGLFVAAMTACRFAGTHLLDRWGRTAVLWSTMAAAGLGVLLIVLGGHPALVVVGHRPLGCGCVARLPGRDECRRGRPGPRRGAGERRLDHRVRRLPRRAPAPGLRRRPGRHAQRPARRGRPARPGSARRPCGAQAGEPVGRLAGLTQLDLARA